MSHLILASRISSTRVITFSWLVIVAARGLRQVTLKTKAILGY